MLVITCDNCGKCSPCYTNAKLQIVCIGDIGNGEVESDWVLGKMSSAEPVLVVSETNEELTTNHCCSVSCARELVHECFGTFVLRSDSGIDDEQPGNGLV